MKFTAFLIFPLLASVCLTSCVVPAYDTPGVSGSVGVSYNTYATLPTHYVGDAYYYQGRYYSGGRYERGSFHDHGRTYSDRYHYNGQYYYGGRHEHHGGGGNGYRDANRRDPRDYSGYRESSWQPTESVEAVTVRRTR